MVGQSDWLPMMIATGLAAMRAPFRPAHDPEKHAPDVIRGGEPIFGKDHAQRETKEGADV
jgi:hypothetical protein